MASLVSTSLSHNLSGDDVIFTVNARIRFQQHERDALWYLRMTFMEEDMVFDDKLHSVNRPFFASSTEVDVSFSVAVTRKKVNTEWGKEEVYAALEVVPLRESTQFVIGKARTNITKVSV